MGNKINTPRLHYFKPLLFPKSYTNTTIQLIVTGSKSKCNQFDSTYYIKRTFITFSYFRPDFLLRLVIWLTTDQIKKNLWVGKLI